MATARKLPSGSWRVRVYDSTTGKYKSFTSDDTSAKGKRKAEKMADDYLLGLQIKANDTSIQAAIEEYISLRSNRLSPATIDKYEKVYKQLSPEFLRLKMDKITDKDIIAEVNLLSGKYAPKTIRNIMALVLPIIRDQRPELAKHIDLPKIQRNLKEYPRAENIIDMFKGDKYELEVLLAVCAGLRKEEIRGLKPSDLKGNVLTINRVKTDVGTKTIVKEEAKTVDSRRRIVLPPFIIDLYKERKGEYILMDAANSLYRHYKRVVKKAGYDISFHDLRHINASEMKALNIPDKYAMERGGWSTDNVLKSVYQSTFSDERQKYDTIIDNHFEQIYKKYDTKYDTNKSKSNIKIAKIRYFKRVR